MGSARTEATKKRRERTRARKASQISAKERLHQATSTTPQTSYDLTAISVQSIPPSPMAAKANSRAQTWVQAGNPNIEPSGNRKGGLHARLKSAGTAKPMKQQIEEGRHRSHSLTTGSLVSEQGCGRGASTSGNWPLVTEFHTVCTEHPEFIMNNKDSTDRVLQTDTELSPLYESISLTAHVRVARTMASRIDNPSRGRWADSLAGPKGGVMLYPDGDRPLSSPARLTQSASHAVDDTEQPRVPSLRSGNSKKKAAPLEKMTPKPAAHLRALPAPQPTEAYLVQASRPTQELSRPRSILLVLDLNGTLLYRKGRSRPHNIIARPHVGEFLQYLLSKFSVMIWSSATPASVAAMCSKLFSAEQRRLLVAEWGRDKLGLTPEQYFQKVQVYKQLGAVWDSDVAASHPEYNTGGRWDQSNTILLDDTALKANAQPFNHISVPEFIGNREPGDGRSMFNQVIRYLEVIILQRDVSSYIQKAPFRVAKEWDTWCSSV
ncbi:MAG: hypothetical protein M1840_004852 [Geoglossum simile]|nr:MAG: hypothetical protein M1840_004852 [Geoglossum simile]